MKHLQPFFFLVTQSRAGNDRFRPVGGREWWRGLAVVAAPAPAPGLGPANDVPLSWLPGHTRRSDACAAVAGLARPASGTGERPDPGGNEEARRLGGGGRDEQAAGWRRPR